MNIKNMAVFLLSMHLMGCSMPELAPSMTAEQNICVRACNENNINCNQAGTYIEKECMACKAKCL